MMTQLIHEVLNQRGATFRAYFSALNDQDFQAILNGPSKTLLEVLQLRYGFGPGDAKAAWNDFVVRHIDGRTSTIQPDHPTHQQPRVDRPRPHQREQPRVVARELEVLGSHGMPSRDYAGLLALVGSGAIDPTNASSPA